MQFPAVIVNLGDSATMWIRHRLDVQWRDVAYAYAATALATTGTRADIVEAQWAGADKSLACLSVRSGFDLLLEALDLPVGSEIVMSAVTIPSMAHIAEAHGLVVVPVDLEFETLAPSEEFVKKAITPRTRAMVVVQLFGGRNDLSSLADICQEKGILLIEDLAQDFRNPEYNGHDRADVTMMSFGPIKTMTSFGGALLRVEDPSILTRMRSIHDGWGKQERRAFLSRVSKFSAMQFVGSTFGTSLIASYCSWRDKDMDALINGAAHSFGAGEDPGHAILLGRIRQQPSAPLLALMHRRLRTFNSKYLDTRQSLGEQMCNILAGSPIPVCVGLDQLDRTFWMFPVVVDKPQAFIKKLRSKGFDPAQGATTICALPAPADRPELDPVNARELLQKAVFVPAYPKMGHSEIERLGRCILDYLWEVHAEGAYEPAASIEVATPVSLPKAA